MTLAAGTRLGPYEIIDAIGAGGMGEVYRARDTKLHREVAIKVLPEVASDPDRLKRFEREAQTLAALNHPHIAQVHGFDDSTGVAALVMELVEGPTLADRIAHGPIALDEALTMAKQIADALEAAHEHGIVHRDLKPANIKVRSDGTVKVLDFGLAKAFDPLSSSKGSASISPTLSIHATQAGVVLGTAAYMAPEQARGKAVDKRADIWAFGVVLFEMLTGRRPFAGDDDVMATVASVIKDPPAFAALPAETPAAIRRLLRRCLEKDPRQRLADIADARLEIADAIDATPEIAEASAVATRTGRTFGWQLVAAVLAIVAAAGWWVWLRDRRAIASTPTSAFRLDVDLGPDVSLDTIGPAAILSPAGTRLVVVSKGADQQARLVTRLLEQPKATVLPGTEGAYGPFFSPDGQWVGFFAGGKLKKTRIDGSQVVTLCDASVGRGASWSDDGASIVAALDNQNNLVRIPADGGTPTPVTKFKGDERSHRWPQVLPGHKAVLFTANAAAGNFAAGRIAVVSLNDQAAASDHTILLTDAGLYPRYLPTGHLIFVSKERLYAAPFDLDRLTMRGTPVPVLEEVSNDTSFGAAQIDVSASGTLLYHRGRTAGSRSIQWLNSAGGIEPLLGEPGMYIYPKLSPDGDRLAFGNAGESGTDIWVYNARAGTRTKLTDGSGQKAYPIWSPDARYLVFSSEGKLFWVPSDAAQRPKVLMTSQGSLAPYSFTPDGKILAFVARSADGKWSLMTVPIRGGSTAPEVGTPKLFVDLPSGAATSAFSPDGRWLAYTSNESGLFEVYVRDFPDNGTKRLVSSGGGMMPMWSRNSKELFYRTDDQRLMVASYVVKDGSFVADPPRLWSTQRIANVGMTGNVDLAPDGKRFAALMPATAAEAPDTRGHFTLVLNFFDDVRRRLASAAK